MQSSVATTLCQANDMNHRGSPQAGAHGGRLEFAGFSVPINACCCAMVNRFVSARELSTYWQCWRRNRASW
jgi:hypothetical protein